MNHSDAKSMLSPTSVQARRPPVRNRSSAVEQKSRDSFCLTSRTAEVTAAWAQASAMPSSRSSASFVPPVQSSRFSIVQPSAHSSLEDSAPKIPQSSSVILPPSRFAGKSRVSSQSDLSGLSAALSSIATGAKHTTPRMSVRASKKDEASSAGGFESSAQILEVARPGQVAMPAKGLHAYLGGKDPLEALDELADDIDMSTTSTIGRGHFGEVKRARRKRDGLCVAVKFIPLQEVGPSVRREVQAMHDLEQHPSLIRLVDVYVSRRSPLEESQCDNPYICIVTEFIEGAEPLARRISVGGAQPNLASHVIPQLAESLAFVHQRGYVHRDVWTENILLKSTGHVILVDFGASVRHDTGDSVTDRLNIPYAAPESSHRARQGTGEDCWAVGLVTSEIVTGVFLCDRIGTSTIPAYQKLRVMKEVKTETASIGGTALGTLCTDLLHFDPSSRTAMKDVKSYFNAATSTSSGKGTGSYRLERPSMSRASTQEPSPANTPAAVWPPQVPRLPTPTPSICQSSLKHSLPETCIKPPNSCKFIAGDLTRGDLDSKLASALSFIDDSLDVGVEISYIARSNGMSYQGVIEGRSSDDKSWHLTLHCGESKVVPDSDAWRISRIR